MCNIAKSLSALWEHGRLQTLPLCMQSCTVLASLFPLSQSGHPTVGDRQGGTQSRGKVANTGQFPLLQWHE